jgi:hypothetical protein
MLEPGLLQEIFRTTVSPSGLPFYQYTASISASMRASKTSLCLRVLETLTRVPVQAVDRALLVDILPRAEQAKGNAWAAIMLGIGSVAGFFL